MNDLTKNVVARAATPAQYWICKAPVPRGDKRVACGAQQANSDTRCTECGAPRGFTTTTTSNKKEKNMSTEKNVTSTKPTGKPTTTTTTTTVAHTPAPTGHKPAPAPVAAPAPVTTAVAPATVVPAPVVAKKVRFYSTKPEAADYSFRILTSLVEKFGAPNDPWGNKMVTREAGGAPAVSKKAQRIDAKEAEKTLLAGMNDEQKIAYAKSKREASQKEQAAKKLTKKLALMAELKAELEKDGLIVKA